jgi:glycosyltransferase 2 family protein
MHPQETDLDARDFGKVVVRHWKIALSYAIAVLCLAWVLYNIQFESFLQNIRNLKWDLVLLAVAVDNLNYIAQAVRWKYLLRPVFNISTGKSIHAMYVGVFASNVLPMRLGEVVRGYLVSKWHSKKFSEIIPSMVVEHLFEGIWLTLGIGFATILIPMPSYIKTGAQIFGFGVIVLAGIFFYALIREGKSLGERHRDRLSRNPWRKFQYFMEQMADGMKKIGLTPDFFIALVVTLVSLIMQALALWLVALACGIPLEVWKGAVVLVILRVGVVIPNAPANIGTYQFFTALGMELLGVDRYVSTGFAIILFFISMTPTWIIGLFVLRKSGTSLHSLQLEAEDAAKE